jgi:hypothetical protein
LILDVISPTFPSVRGCGGGRDIPFKPVAYLRFVCHLSYRNLKLKLDSQDAEIGEFFEIIIFAIPFMNL